MSSNCGAASPLVAKASRSIVLQKGHAVAMVFAPVATSSAARTWLTRSPVSSPRKERPPPAPQQKLRSWLRGASTTVPAKAATASATKAALVVARGFDYGSGQSCNGARLVVDVAIAAQVAGIVEYDFFFP